MTDPTVAHDIYAPPALPVPEVCELFDPLGSVMWHRAVREINARIERAKQEQAKWNSGI